MKDKQALGNKITLVEPAKYFNIATRPISAVLDSFNTITQYAVNNYAKLI